MLVDGHFDGLHLGQHLHAALRLPRLRRLGFEAVDKGLHMLARGFLLLGERGIERALGAARRNERVVAAGIERELAVFEMQDEFGRGVQKIAVMADDQHRAAIAPQEILQPQHAFQIEIVGGLVQQQQIGAGEQDRRQRHAHAPAAGKLGTGAQLFFGGKSETRQNRGGARRRGIGVDVVEPGVDIAQRMRFGFGLGGQQQLVAFAIGRQHRIEQAVGAARCFLRHRADLPLARPGHVAAVGRELTQDHLQQRGFARAVPADQADAAACGQIGGRAADDLAARDADSDVVEAQHDGSCPKTNGIAVGRSRCRPIPMSEEAMMTKAVS